jgi:two-component system, chemotaxis family, sensor histidine kinase and response regulator WspE
MSSSDDLSQHSMLDLFRLEAETQAQILNAGLLALERKPDAAEHLEACMRAAHSLKGAARIVEINAGVSVAHAMEDCFVAAQQGRLMLSPDQIDQLLGAVDLLTRIATPPGGGLDWGDHEGHDFIEHCLTGLRAMLAPSIAPVAAPASLMAAIPSTPALPLPASPAAPEAPRAAAVDERSERVLRVTADNLNRLLSLSGEAVVETRWLQSFSQAMLRLKRLQRHAGQTLELLQERPADKTDEGRQKLLVGDLREQLSSCQQLLAEQLVDLDRYDQRATQVAQRLYDEALACRMRPFADGVSNYARVVRDLGRTLGKQARLEIIGEGTEVDRDILEKLDAPLGHLIRNALDHGIEIPTARSLAGKPAEGLLTLEARHHAGLLQITLADDGQGIDIEQLRQMIVERQLSRPEVAVHLSPAELLEFLFLPGFSMRGTVTEISGRGVGLDVVQNMVKQVRGSVRIFTSPGQGTRFQLQLPLTLSVVRSLLVSVGGQPYALPLAHVGSALVLEPGQIELLEGRQHFNYQGRRLGLASAHQILHPHAAMPPGENTAVVVIGHQADTVGLAVDGFLGERMLVVQALDTRLGKIKDIASGALMEDGTPVLIIDVEDMLRSIDKLITSGQIEQVRHEDSGLEHGSRKRILVADDSLTVRELERKLLASHGYDVAVAVDGMDGWNALRTEAFDLLVTDIDMPRMDGIELVRLIKADPHLKGLPVMIVSYKDRDEDRQRGLDAGADYYLAKGSFHDSTLIDAVLDLIGASGAA